MKVISTKDAVGCILCHDITQIIKGQTKGPVFRKGHIVTEEDIPVLLRVGKENLYVWEPKGCSMRMRVLRFFGSSAREEAEKRRHLKARRSVFVI